MVRVTRGRTYQFTVMAGETHPFYITDTIIGGGARPMEASTALGMVCGMRSLSGAPAATCCPERVPPLPTAQDPRCSLHSLRLNCP